MSPELPLLTALLAGAISFLSPCVLPLVPPYLGYMAGVSLDTLAGGKTGPAPAGGATALADTAISKTAQRRVVMHAAIFVLGFSLVFTALGAGASSIGQWIRAWQDTLAIIAGLAIIVMGLHFLGLFRISLLYREARFNPRQAGLAGSFLMGLAFAFGWTPCIGPVLGVILAMASSSNSVAEGAGMLAVYSAGLGIPFLLAALFVGPFMGFLARFKKHLHTMEQVTGGLLIVTGILFLTGGMQTASFWLLETFPVLGTIG
ncbi:cytochrome c biogenesis CcdA family protein [Salaquimonas pukyongi]|uniref:cytochrome c biogenesis CcdA family protein n=1 Tax=Salaquimonas pukyongi TaxID=2712698 RepID=UPI00096B8338|nr:cytochrome c biogenesis protein CcdA [Salaquimonas pukyongi]